MFVRDLRSFYMKIPTYLKENNYKVVELKEYFSFIRIVNELEKDKYNEFFELGNWILML